MSEQGLMAKKMVRDAIAMDHSAARGTNFFYDIMHAQVLARHYMSFKNVGKVWLSSLSAWPCSLSFVYYHLWGCR